MSDKELQGLMFFDPNPLSRYKLYKYCEMGPIGIVSCLGERAHMVETADLLGSFSRFKGNGDWYEVIERASGRTIFSTRLALEVVPKGAD